MMARFYSYIDKVFEFRRLIGSLTDSRLEPVSPTAAVFGTAFTMCATCRGSLNGIDKERHFPGRLRPIVGRHVPGGDTVGRAAGPACLAERLQHRDVTAVGTREDSHRPTRTASGSAAA